MNVDIKGKTLKDECVVLDIETTGFSARNDAILRIDAVEADKVYPIHTDNTKGFEKYESIIVRREYVFSKGYRGYLFKVFGREWSFEFL